MSYTIDRETLGSHIEGVRRLARSLVRGDAEADDVVQETMLVALESRASRRAGPKAWLAGVTRNLARRSARTESRRKKREQAVAKPEAEPATDEVVIRAAEQSRLLDAVVSLAEPYRTAILLRYVEGMPPRDIAARQEIPVETARTHVKRGLQKLREQLDEAHGGRRAAWLPALLLAAGGPPRVAAATATAGVPALLVVAAVLGHVVVLGALWFALGLGGDDDPAPAWEPPVFAHAEAEADEPEDDEKPEPPPAAPKEGDKAKEPSPSPAPTDDEPPVPGTQPGDDGGRGTVYVGPATPTPPGEGTFRYADNGYVVLDPARADPDRANDERLTLALFEGLTILDPQTGAVLPGAAKEWKREADGRTWRFTLRKDAVWSDGSPVLAADFVRAWRRILDPFTQATCRSLFRPLAGCATIIDSSAATEVYSRLRNGLRQLKAANPNGIPGEELLTLVADTGARPYLVGLNARTIKRILGWKPDDLLPPEMTDKAVAALKKARKEHKELWEDAFESFDTRTAWAYDRTLVIRTDGEVPFLPALLARAAFVPLHEKHAHLRGAFFGVGNLIANGPYVLEGRGAKPRAPGVRTTSVVALERNKKYRGPHGAAFAKVVCFTDLTLDVAAADELAGLEGVRQYLTGRLEQVFCTWPGEYPRKERMRRGTQEPQPKPVNLRRELASVQGWTVRPTPRVLALRFRCDRPPFDNRDARIAFARALDRETLAGHLWPQARPAWRLLPFGVTGRVEGLSALAPDTDAARKAFKAGKLESDTWVELSYGEAAGEGDVARALIAHWKKTLGIEPGTRIESDPELPGVVRNGGYQVLLDEVRGFVNDPYGVLAPFHSKNANSGLGWRDPIFDALLDAARDPEIALRDKDAWLRTVGSGFRTALRKVRLSAEDREAFRVFVLVAAEKRLLDECVVVPLLQVREGVLIRPKSRGIGSAAAFSTPGFAGSFRHVQR